MIAALMFLLARPPGPIGFFGQTGFIWVVLGLLVFVVVVAILFKIFRLLMPQLGVSEPWITIIYWVLVLLIFLCFVNYAFGGYWW